MNPKRIEIKLDSRLSGGAVMRRFLLTFILTGFLVGCTQAPAHKDAWLSIKYGLGCGDYTHCTKLTDFGEGDNYYVAIGEGSPAANANPPGLTFGKWKQTFGYPGNGVVQAVYGNQLDLQFGREMNCWQFGQGGVACYVSNYGPPPTSLTGENPAWPNLDGHIGVPGAPGGAVFDAATENNPFAIVAMVYDPAQIGVKNGDTVAFYVFNPIYDPSNIDNSPPSDQATLDGEGGKSVPRMCMACHGGSYDETKHSVTGASFLPFDVWSFDYTDFVSSRLLSLHPLGLYLERQQEAFRQLNAMVLATKPNQPIADLINGLYSNNVATPGATVPDDSYIAPGWITPDNNGQKVYKGVFRRYCRMCHLASQGFSFPSYAQFQNSASTIQQFVICGSSNNVLYSHDMPHTEVPFGGLAGSTNRFGAGQGFWMDSIAQNDLNVLFQSQNVKCQ
jgi:hypothetical protein